MESRSPRKSVHVVQRVFRHESSVRSTLAIASGRRDGGEMRVVPTHRASGRPVRQGRIDHAGSNCAVAEFGDLRANSRCILGARPAPHQKALSGARHRNVSGVMQGNFADDDFLVACHHGPWIGGFGRRLCRPVALRRAHQRLYHRNA